MSRAPDLALRAAWQRRMRAFDNFAGTVPQFCAQEHISVASFYQWRRKLAKQESRQAPAAHIPPATPPSFVALQFDRASSSLRGGLSIDLPNGAHLEVCGDDLALVQAVLNCLLAQENRRHSPGDAA